MLASSKLDNLFMTRFDTGYRLACVKQHQKNAQLHDENQSSRFEAFSLLYLNFKKSVSPFIVG